MSSIKIRSSYTRYNLIKEFKLDEFVPRTEAIAQAYEWGSQIHAGQKRLTGEPYFETHCGWVGNLVDQMAQNEAWTIAALLHDAIEDQNVSLEDIRKKFPGILGESIAPLVDGVTKLITSRDGRSKEIETLRKIAAYRDPGVFVIKLADRSHNILTLEHMPKQKQIAKAEEAIRAYGRLAGILNCHRWRCWLEDIAFPFYQHNTYDFVSNTINADPRLQPQFLEQMSWQLANVMEKEGVTGEIHVVANGYWQSWMKLKKLARERRSSLHNFGNIDDLVSFRLILETEDDRDCYRLLAGVNRYLGSYLDQTGFDDYIAIPQNGYRALHVTGWFGDMGAIEVAITTREMEGENMWGVVHNMRHHLPTGQYQPITILTPTGGMRFLEEGASVLDAVASIQQDFFLDKVNSVEVNGKLAHLSDRVQSGDVIEVTTGDNPLFPNESWLSFSSRATTAIVRSVLVNQALKLEAEQGRKLIRPIIFEHGIVDLDDVANLEPERVERLLGYLASPFLEDLYIGLGGGAIPLEDFSEALARANISRQELAWSTIYLIGPKKANRPGIMALLTSVIWESGSNILRIVNNTYPDGSFDVRIVTVEYTDEQREHITQALQSLKEDVDLFMVEVA
ncbi:MAG: HD domain-containing protein [Anaerolineae bacterium]|nr:HD domain-containing protein [Anaerolineae bacterium]